MYNVKKVISLILVFIIIICNFCPIEVYAFARSDGTLSQEELDANPKYWIQGAIPADNSLITGKSGSDTIGAGACSHFAMTYALVKMGIFNPKNGDTPITHIENARSKNAFLTDWGYFNFGRVSELYPDVSHEGTDYNVGGMSAENGLKYVKGKMSEGYYVVGIVYGAKTNGHCIFFDGVNSEGKMVIGDSGYEGTTFEDVYINGGTHYFSYLELLKCKGKDVNSMPSIYDDTALRGITSTEVLEYKTLVEQWDLVGMPSKSHLSGTIVKPEILDYTSLTQAELSNLQAIKDIKDADKLSFFDVAKTVISVVGFLLIIYALLLVMAYIFDKVNSFISVSLVSLLTLGHLKVTSEIEYAELDGEMKSKKGYIKAGKLIVIVIVLMLLGGLMVSGQLSYWIFKIIQGG